MPSLAAKRARLAAAVALVLVTALPVAFLKTPPMIDVLGHMGRYEVQTGLDSDPWLATFYAFHWQLIGNLGADVVVQAFQPLLGMLRATRLAIVLVPLIAAAGILLLSRQVHGRITPFAVTALALIYGLPFTWGFLNFSLSMALALLAFALWLRLGPGPRRALLFVPLGMVVWVCHTFGWAFLGILCTADALARAQQSGRPDRTWLLAPLRQCWPLLAPLVPMLLWRSSATGAGIDGWFDLPQKAGWILATLRLDVAWIDKLSCGVLLVVLLLALLSLIPALIRGSSRFAVDRTLAVAACIALAAFLLLPRQIFGSVFADMRLAPYVLILGLLCLRDTSVKWRLWPMTAALAFVGFRLALTGNVYLQREHDLESHLTALQAIPAHARLATLVEVPCQSEWALPWFSHIGSVALVRKHVFANDQWANSSMNPLTVRYPAAGPFATDDRQLFFPRRCGMMPTLAQSLRALPAHAFSHVWVVGVAPDGISHRSDLTLTWHGSDAAVFAVMPGDFAASAAH